MTTSTLAEVDYSQWLSRWETQQSSYIPLREERFTAMLDILERTVGPKFTVIDLMCGPGAISRRILERFQDAKVLAIDLDPVLLAIGRESAGAGGGRLTWLEGNLKASDWPCLLPVSQVDAVVSTTAIHWLFAGEIVELYRTLAGLIRPGGVFLNGDQMKFTTGDPTIQQLSLGYREDFRAAAQARGAESWEQWWLALRKESGLTELFAERDRRFAWRTDERERAIGSTAAETSPRVNTHTTYPVHVAALQDAGFSEVGTIWQHFDNRVLMAVR